mgnify:CR=1 FL=1
MSICLFGGTFDPVHTGHLIMAECAMNELNNINKMIFVPSARPPHKDEDDYTPFQDRFKMLELAIKDNPKFFISDVENRMAGKSYSVRTIKFFREKYKIDEKELYFLIGEDSLINLNTWKEPDKIVALTTLLVVNRRCSNTNNQSKYYNNSRMIQDAPYIDISSTMIRENVKTGKSVKYLVPDLVEEYIMTNHFYKN